MRIPYVGTILALLCLSFAAYAGDGVFMVVKGDIRVQAQAGGEQKAKVGLKVQEGDTVIAGADARAKIVMVDKNVLNISPDTKITIEKYKFDAAKDEKSVSLNVLYGKVRSTVNQKYDGEKNTFNIKTPSAVAGVRGTDFVTGYNRVTSTTKIVTFEGRVMTGTGFDARGKMLNPVAVNPGQFTVASRGMPPAPPAEVPKAELVSMKNETKADSPATSGGGDNRAPSDDGGKEDKNKDKGDDKKGPDDKKAPEENKGPAPREGAAPPPASMGVSDNDMMARDPSGTEPPKGPPVFQDCAACRAPATGFPQQLPTELLQNGPTKLIINVQ